MRPNEVLDAQIDLIDRLGTGGFRKYIGDWAAAEFEWTGGQPSPGLDQFLRNHARAAYAYRVTHDMSLLIEQMAAELDDTDRFTRDLLPTGCGIVCFDRPLPIHDIRGRVMLAHWLVWGPTEVQTRRRPGDPFEKKSAIVFWSFNDRWRQLDEVEVEFESSGRKDLGPEAMDQYIRAIGRWAPCGTTIAWEQMPVGSKILEPSEKHRAEVLADGVTPVSGTNTLRYIQALLMLLNQTIVSISDEEPNRPARRRAQRMNIPAKVSVIALRRSETPYRAEGESLVEWSHRWLSRAHWRWQRYGPRKSDHVHEYGPVRVEQGGLVRRCQHSGCENYEARISVRESIKGPADKPLVITDKVYDLRR